MRACRRTPRANGRTRRRRLDRPGPGACRRQARAPSSKELAQGGPAQQLPRRDEVADHPHEGLEQRRAAGEGAREAVGERAPRDDEPKGAGDPFLVASGGAARLRIGAEGARGHIAAGEGAVSHLDEELGRVERGMESLAHERIIDAGGIADQQDAARSPGTRAAPSPPGAPGGACREGAASGAGAASAARGRTSPAGCGRAWRGRAGP